MGLASGAMLSLGSGFLASALPALSPGSGAGLLGGASPAGAESHNLLVTTEEDVTNPDDGVTSLREAVAAFSSTLADEITFADHVDTVRTNDVPITILDPMTINGPGVTVTTAGGEADDPHRVFDIDLSEHGADTVTLRGLTITGGHAVGSDGEVPAGGGIRAFAVDLELDTVTVTGNAAEFIGGGVYAGGEYAGGAGSELRLTNSTITGNSALVGAGIAVKYVTDVTFDATVGGLVIDRSTISGNGGALGGGVFAYLSDVTMENSTISGNSAANEAGGILVNGGSAAIRHSTVNDNRVDDPEGAAGGLWLDGTTTFLSHSIFANSTRTSAPEAPFDLVITGESTVDAQYALIEALDDPSDALTVTGPPIITADPGLAALAQAGPTASHRPLPGSPAINAGDPSISAPPLTDQTGSARVVGAGIDLGSVEATDSDGDGIDDQHDNCPTIPPCVVAVVVTPRFTG